MGMIQEFKEFAMKGNLIDLAIGFVMGAAFTKLTTAFIDGMVMPAVGMLTTGEDFGKLRIVLKHEIADAAGKVTQPEVAVKYGAFINDIINFIIVAFVMFLIVKLVNSMRKSAPAAEPAAPTASEKLLMEIRDELKK